MTSWADGLNGPAYDIAASTRSPLRVVAGPGTGKTFALKRRVARLLESGTDARRILATTFTRTAAADLRKELLNLGVDAAEGVRTGTVHGLCFGVLNRNTVLEITGRVPRPLLAFEERFLLEDLAGDGLGTYVERRKRLRAFAAAWARLQSEEPGWPTDPLDKLFHQELMKWLRFHRAMLIGELVPETLRYLKNNPAADERGAFDHVLVDEYQDLNRAEQELLDFLAQAGSLAIIGDEDQSIYRFKYAHPEGIARFHETHQDTCDLSLTTCRRLPHRVVDLANALISRNPGRAARQFEKFDGNPQGEVFIVQWTSMSAEAAGLADFIQRRIASGTVEAGQVLVLTPRREFGHLVRDRLIAAGVPAHSFFSEEPLQGKPKVMAECEAQQAFTLLCLLADEGDLVALRCWCGFGSASLLSGAWSRIRERCATDGPTPRELLQRLADGDERIPHTKPIVDRYRELLKRLAALDGLTGQALVDALFPETAEWAEPFRAFARGIASDDPVDPSRLRDILRSSIAQPELPTDVDYVRVMSLHKSKGLTADLVIVAGCIDGLLPSVDRTRPQAEQEAELEEQRRVFYVAITRPRHTLVLSSVTQLPADLAYSIGARVRAYVGKDRVRTLASQFLHELGPTAPAPVAGPLP